MFLIGLNDKTFQEYLLRESNLHLNKTIEICRIVEVTRSQAHLMQNNTTINPDYNVDKIRRQFSNNQKSQKERPELIKICKFLSFLHKHMENSAITVKRKIILQNAVMSKKLTFHKYQDSSESDENSEIFETEYVFLVAISSEDFTAFNNDDSEWTADLEAINILISFKIDTDAQANMLTFRVFLNLQNRPKLQPSKFSLSVYNGTNIPVKGCCILHVTHSVTPIPVLFQIVDNDSPSILGLKNQ